MILLPVLIFVMVITARIFSQKRQIDSQIRKLQQQADKIKKDNDQLSYLVKYLNTPEYQEKQAREKLNLRKDGEYVVVLPQKRDKKDLTQTVAEKESNFKKWFNYFFSNP